MMWKVKKDDQKFCEWEFQTCGPFLSVFSCYDPIKVQKVKNHLRAQEDPNNPKYLIHIHIRRAANAPVWEAWTNKYLVFDRFFLVNCCSFFHTACRRRQYPEHRARLPLFILTSFEQKEKKKSHGCFVEGSGAGDDGFIVTIQKEVWEGVRRLRSALSQCRLTNLSG